ncbi:MAG: hypothetical protein K0U54_05835 [Bacteroidetes bacterium]|nr:hypothetical protein [Bacteroidota bacterium]
MLHRTFCLLFVPMTIFGQTSSFKGLATSRHGGIHAVIYNPAAIGISPNKVELNVASGYTLLGSDYSYIELGDGINLTEGFNFESENTTGKTDNNFYRNVDIAGPAAMVYLDRHHSVGISTRIRGMYNINNLRGELLQGVSGGFDFNENSATVNPAFSGTLNTWGELGLTYAYSHRNVHCDISFGATIKFLSGIGGLFFHSQGVEASIDADRKTTTLDGQLNFGSTIDFDSSDITLDTGSLDVGLDIGAIFKFSSISLLKGRAMTLRVSIVDIGQIEYEEVKTTTYFLDEEVNSIVFDTKDIVQTLNVNYARKIKTVPRNMKLPTSVHLFLDTELSYPFNLGIETSFSLRSKKTFQANRVFNYVTLNPRYETRRIGVFSPISIQQHTGLSWGFGFSVGYVTLGSGSIVSNIISASKVNDVYVGIKLPIKK